MARTPRTTRALARLALVAGGLGSGTLFVLGTEPGRALSAKASESAEIVASNPALVGVGAGLLMALVAGGPRWARRDPVRWFDADQRRAARHRAGGQCEYSTWLRRCERPAQETDHFIAWARGGATTLTNAVAACRRHNQGKGASAVPGWQVMALRRRRRTYFPPGTPIRPGQRYRPGLPR